MQETRQHILEILREFGQATVDDIVDELHKRRGRITAVTVRHHLSRLQEADLITAPQLRHRSTPGRPQHVYALTDKACEHFPQNYQRLAAGLISQIERHLPPEGVNVIIEGVADSLAEDVQLQHLPFKERLERVVTYLSEQGYQAHWEESAQGYILHTTNCPYHEIAHASDTLCGMDMRLVSQLLGVVPRRLTRIAEGDASCAYLIPSNAGQD